MVLLRKIESISPLQLRLAFGQHALNDCLVAKLRPCPAYGALLGTHPKVHVWSSALLVHLTTVVTCSCTELSGCRHRYFNPACFAYSGTEGETICFLLFRISKWL